MAGSRKKPAKNRAAPWSKEKAARRVLTLDEQWAEMVRARVRADCHPFQLAAVDDPSRFITLLVGRGGGKTTAIRARAIIKLTSLRRGKLVYLALTKAHAEELLWEPIKASIEFYGLTDDFTFNETKLRVTCKRTGATLRLVGMDKRDEIEKLRGQPFDEVYIDECASHDPKLLENVIDRVIGPRLGDRRGCLVLTGTPGHILRGRFYDTTRPGSLRPGPKKIPYHRPYKDRDKAEYEYAIYGAWKGWSSHAWTLKDVVDLPNAATKYVALSQLWEDALEKKDLEQWSDENPIWLREYLGQWAADDTEMVFKYRPFKDGQPWNRWDPFEGRTLAGVLMLRAAIAALPADLKDWRYVICDDVGSSDPFACNIFAFSPQDRLRRIFHVFAFEQTSMYARPIAEQLVGDHPEQRTDNSKLDGLLGVIGWPDGMVMDGDQTTIDELSKVYGLRFTKADRNPLAKQGAIELTNGDLIDGRILIIAGSPLEQQLQALQWAEDQHGRVKENKAQSNHSTDTLVYGRKLIAQLFESGAVAQDTSGEPASYADPQGLDASAGDETSYPGGGEDKDLQAPTEFYDSWGNQ